MKELYRRGLTIIGGAGMFGAGTAVGKHPFTALLIGVLSYTLIIAARDSKREGEHGKNKKAV